mmetsp:Transcript_59167/g.141271  ORF Transcript_59167/g.141271 Transcript_59167/m.141271 type:complete len:267 (-) Transcript_59167:2502-3302(-)
MANHWQCLLIPFLRVEREIRLCKHSQMFPVLGLDGRHDRPLPCHRLGQIGQSTIIICDLNQVVHAVVSCRMHLFAKHRPSIGNSNEQSWWNIQVFHQKQHIHALELVRLGMHSELPQLLRSIRPTRQYGLYSFAARGLLQANSQRPREYILKYAQGEEGVGKSEHILKHSPATLRVGHNIAGLETFQRSLQDRAGRHLVCLCLRFALAAQGHRKRKLPGRKTVQNCLRRLNNLQRCQDGLPMGPIHNCQRVQQQIDAPHLQPSSQQ